MTHENSREAAAQGKRAGKPYSYRRKIYEILSHEKEGLTDREIINRLQEQDVNNVRPEITRLKQDRLVAEVGKKKCPITGKSVRIVRYTGRPYFDKCSKKAAAAVIRRATTGLQGVLFSALLLVNFSVVSAESHFEGACGYESICACEKS